MDRFPFGELEAVKRILHNAKHAVFFGGAGVSTESGIPDFRGNGGLYESEEESNEYYLSRECLTREPEKFYRFFRKNMMFPSARPNGAHLALANLEKRGIIHAVITQNVDALHQAAGSRRVIELHGTAGRYICTGCRREYDAAEVDHLQPIPLCGDCSAPVRPDVTLYGEPLDGFNYADALSEVKKADVLLVGGTSLVVHPAASLLDAFSGEHLIIVNLSPTPYDALASHVIRESLSSALGRLAEE
ncbi:MAG: NAD-dependent protein deacylase [Clostridia bacterium]|nr:NAD-dependent protein deacylase [Clostridia bacterium]